MHDAVERRFYSTESRQCFYDGGVDIIGTEFTTSSCSRSGSDQRFGPKFQDEPWTELHGVGRGKPITILIPGIKGKCFNLDQWGSRPVPCNKDTKELVVGNSTFRCEGPPTRTNILASSCAWT